MCGACWRPCLDLPVKRIRVIKPRIGGGFGGKQEVLMEDVAGASDDCHQATGHLRIHARRGIHRRALAPPDEGPDEDRREARWDDHRQFDVCAVRYGRVWLSRADRHRQHRSQVHGAVCWRWRISQGAEYPLLRGCGLHQHAARRRVPRLRRAAGLLAARPSHGKDRPRA